MDEENLLQEAEQLAGTQATEQQQQLSEAQQQAQDRLRQLLEAQGISVGDNVEDAARSIAESIRARKEAEERARKREEELYLYQQELEKLKSVQSPKPPEQPQKRKGWDPVEIPEQYLALIKQDRSSGQWIPREGMGPAAVEAARVVNDAERERARRANRLVSNPVEALQEAGLDDILEERMQKLLGGLEERIRSTLQEQQKQKQQEQEMAAITDFRDKNKATLFELDATGNPKLDSNGGFKLTSVGKVFQQELKDAMERGVDPVYAMSTSLRLAKASVKEEPPPPDKKETFTERARQAASGQRKPSVQREESTDESPASSFIEFAMRDPQYQALLKG